VIPWRLNVDFFGLRRRKWTGDGACLEKRPYEFIVAPSIVRERADKVNAGPVSSLKIHREFPIVRGTGTLGRTRKNTGTRS